jgi:hypothetical protein
MLSDQSIFNSMFDVSGQPLAPLTNNLELTTSNPSPASLSEYPQSDDIPKPSNENLLDNFADVEQNASLNNTPGSPDSQSEFSDPLTGMSTVDSIFLGDVSDSTLEDGSVGRDRSASLTADSSIWQVLSANPSLMRYYSRSVSVDRNNGAVGLNQQEYISVGLQRHSSELIAYGILTKDTNLIDTGIKVLEYAFDYQQTDGSFLTTPKSLTTGSAAQDGAFFYYDLGYSMLLLKDSQWFQTAPETASLRSRADELQNPAKTSLTWLVGQEPVLIEKDRSGTNRLLYDANAYYLVGKATGRSDALKLGESFARRALQQQASEGYFLERGGYDSSYNAVSLRQAILLYTNLQSDAASLKQDLEKAIEKSAAWQLTRIAPSGEVLTEGNTRIKPIGEQYTLTGTVKKVDYKEVVLALDYYAKLSGDTTAQNAANRVRNYRP